MKTNLKLEELLKVTEAENAQGKNEIWKNLSDAQKRILRAYYNSKQFEYLLIDDGWEKDADEMYDFLKECKIDKIIFDDNSTEAVKILKKFIKKGATISGTLIYQTKEWFKDKIDIYEGIIIEL